MKINIHTIQVNQKWVICIVDELHYIEPYTVDIQITYKYQNSYKSKHKPVWTTNKSDTKQQKVRLGVRHYKISILFPILGATFIVDKVIFK